VNNLDSLNILKTLAFPLLITTDLPLKLLGIEFSRRIFFNPQTELSDLLGQYRPEGKNFRWIDGELLTAVKEGGTIALADLNLAQQQVVEGINSLFDYRGSIYVVDIGQTFHKASTFRPVVVLKTKVEGDRKMLPNSFLNRFVKLHIK
jgi:midasin